jgi:2,4-dienoyl-CoA reductase-like NADH-dependent reductase (Old Yellow Enzyme family)
VSGLFSPLRLRGVELPNRIGVSPMCMYSSQDGLANNWHLVHLGSRAVGGAGLVMAEASAVSPEGRISPADLGFWSDAHAEALAPSIAFIAEHGAVPAIQLAHAGRKASTAVPWLSRKPVEKDAGGWDPLAPSAIAFAPDSLTPLEMTDADIAKVIADFAAAARRANEAGFRYIECHFAHGYLIHEFLSPLSNFRTDRYGGALENRARLMLEIVAAMRAVLPDDYPLTVRLSVTDWVEGGCDIDQTIEVCRWLKDAGVDLIDCSSGAILPHAQPVEAPGMHVPFSARIRSEAAIATAAVGVITQAEQAEAIIANGEADLVFLARAMLRDPYWPLHAAEALGEDAAWPIQYKRAVRPRRPKPS